MIIFPTFEALSDEPVFDPSEVLNACPSPDQNGRPGVISLNHLGKREQLRFYGLKHPQSVRPPVIFLDGDMMGGSRFNNTLEVSADYGRTSPASLQRDAEQIGLASKRSFINLARPGIFGSSGDHAQRRREREVAVVNEAIDQLAKASGWTQIDLCGYSGGGHLVAALLARRWDVRRAVIASGVVAVRQRINERGWSADATGYTDFVDPIDLVGDIPLQTLKEIVVMTDPDDARVSLAVQTAYSNALKQVGLPVEQRFVTAADDYHHDLRLAAILCALTD